MWFLPGIWIMSSFKKPVVTAWLLDHDGTCAIFTMGFAEVDKEGFVISTFAGGVAFFPGGHLISWSNYRNPGY